jgi:uroporphyrinogen decarboxylase
MANRKEKMIPAERLEALFKGQPVDRVAYVHKGYVFCAKMTGAPVADIYENPQSSFEVQNRTFEMLGTDGTPFYTFSAYGSWEFGGEVRWPEDRMSAGPAVAKHPVEKPEDVFKLELPDPRKAGSVPKMLEFAHLQEKHNMPIAFICGDPFSHAANLAGVSNFMLWMIDAPEAAHHALRLMTDHILSVAKLFIDEFGVGRVIGRANATSDSNALISPRQFKEYSLPYEKELHEKVIAMGVHSLYSHVCGNHNKNLQYWKEVPFNTPENKGVISIGHEVDLESAAEAFPGCVIAGNIEPRLLAQGSVDEIYDGCRRVIEQGKRLKNGFIFMAGCEVPANTPPYNVYLMRKAVEEFGWYD